MTKGKHKGGGKGSNQWKQRGTSKQRSRGSGSTYQTGSLDAVAAAVGTSPTAVVDRPDSEEVTAFLEERYEMANSAREAFLSSSSLSDFRDAQLDESHPRHLVAQRDGTWLSNDGLVKQTFVGEHYVQWDARVSEDAPFSMSRTYLVSSSEENPDRDAKTERNIRANLAYNQALGPLHDPDEPMLSAEELADPSNPRFIREVGPERWEAGDGSWKAEVEWDSEGGVAHVVLIEDGEEIEIEIEPEFDTAFDPSVGLIQSTLDLPNAEAQIRDEMARRQIARDMMTQEQDEPEREQMAYAGLNDGAHWPKGFSLAGASDERYDEARNLLTSAQGTIDPKQFDKLKADLDRQNLTDFGLEQKVNEIAVSAGPSVSPTKLTKGMTHPVFGKVLSVKLPEGQSSTVTVTFEDARHTHFYNRVFGEVAVVE